MIFGVTVVFPVVITFGIDSPGVVPGKANSKAIVHRGRTFPLVLTMIVPSW